MTADAVTRAEDAAITGQGNTRGLFLAGFFLVAVAAFLIHSILLYAPLQGEDLQYYFQNEVSSQSAYLPVELETAERAVLPVFVQSFLWGLVESPLLLRISALLLHLSTSVLVFFLLRCWLATYTKITIPLSGGLLMAATPMSAVSITHSAGWAVLLATVLAMAGGLLFLSGTVFFSRRNYALILLSAWCIALAAAVHHALVILPLLYLLLDFYRIRNGQKNYRRVDWPSHGLLFASGILALFVLYINGKTLPFQSYYLLYLLSAIVILVVCRILHALPFSRTKTVLSGLLVLLFAVEAVFSFMQSLHYADPVWRLEKNLSTGKDAGYRRQLALHYYYRAQQLKNEDEKLVLVDESLSIWPMDEGMREAVSWERLLWGNALMQVNNSQDAVNMVSPVLEQTPFTTEGLRAARLTAAALDETDNAAEIAALFSFVSGKDTLTETETLKYARCVFRLGDMNRAANLFGSLQEFPEDSADGMLQRQALATAKTAGALQESYRKEIINDPQSISGYAALAEASYASGNLLRAFYWLEMTLRRNPDTEGAWELMGTLFALQDSPEYFISQWGALKQDAAQPWFNLARRAAHNTAWEASYKYAGNAVRTGGLSAEEYMALFAVELNQLSRAEEWLSRAVEAHPLSYTPRLLKADVAIAQGDTGEARRYLDEARLLQAPEAEINKRLAQLRQNEKSESSPGTSFEPVRTYIQ